VGKTHGDGQNAGLKTGLAPGYDARLDVFRESAWVTMATEAEMQKESASPSNSEISDKEDN
jgi:hypothetical protein